MNSSPTPTYLLMYSEREGNTIHQHDVLGYGRDLEYLKQCARDRLTQMKAEFEDNDRQSLRNMEEKLSKAEALYRERFRAPLPEDPAQDPIDDDDQEDGSYHLRPESIPGVLEDDYQQDTGSRLRFEIQFMRSFLRRAGSRSRFANVVIEERVSGDDVRIGLYLPLSNSENVETESEGDDTSCVFSYECQIMRIDNKELVPPQRIPPCDP